MPVKRSGRKADAFLVSTLEGGATRARDDVLSPELVLIDPALAVRARERLSEPDDTLERSKTPARDREGTLRPDANGLTRSPFDDAAGAAVRRLAEDALAAETSPPFASPGRQRRRRLVAILAGLSASVALAVLLADQPKLDDGSGARTNAAPAELTRIPAGQRKATEPGPTSAGSQQPKASGSAAEGSGLTPQRFAWAPFSGASGYHVELFRQTTRVFAADTTRPQVTIPARWTFDGREHRLQPVEYRWYVWPIVSGRRTAKAVVQARLVVRDR